MLFRDDIRVFMADLAGRAYSLRAEMNKQWRDWLDACQGQLTLNHLKLYEAKNEVDWAYELIGKMKADIDERCALLDKETERAA